MIYSINACSEQKTPVSMYTIQATGPWLEEVKAEKYSKALHIDALY